MTTSLKQRRFLFAEHVPSSALTAAAEQLQHYPGVVSVRSQDKQMVIEYVLGKCSYRIVEQCLAELQLDPEHNLLKKLKADWARFTETNEIANQTLPAGWQQHEQNLYLSLQTTGTDLPQ